jgi:hypothetical protein
MESLYNDQKPRGIKNPRRMRTAVRAGWHVIEVKVNNAIGQSHNVSHLGLMIWADANKIGRYITTYNGHLSKFAFERIEDAAMFTLKWS